MIFDDMWTALEAYQPQADKYGFGADWKRMTTERTAVAVLRAKESAEEALPFFHHIDDRVVCRSVSWVLEKAFEALIAAKCAADATSEVLLSSIEQESKETDSWSCVGR